MRPNAIPEMPEPIPVPPKKHTITVKQAANMLGMNQQTLRRRMEDKSLDIGVVLPGTKKNTYIITVDKFEKVTGINPNERGKG